jgi:hypothetical protein
MAGRERSSKSARRWASCSARPVANARVSAAGEKVISTVEKLKTDSLMSSLRDGSLTLRVRGVEIIGATGNVIAALGRGTYDVVSELQINDSRGGASG